MTTSDYNPHDIEFLISRAIDGDLGPDEQRLLQERLARSGDLRDEAERLRKVAQLVSQWGTEQPDVDWASHAKLVQAASTERADGDPQLDRVLRGWAAERPVVDEIGFLAGVMSQIGARRAVSRSGNQRRVLRPLLRIGAPLAAAAVLAFSVSTFLWNGPATGGAVSVITMGPAYVAKDKGRAVVSFARDVRQAAASTDASSITFLTLGAAPVNPLGESAPL